MAATRISASNQSADWDLEVFFDGDCPLCLREIRMLQRLDSKQRKIRFTDISSPSFLAEELGVSQATLMARIHGRLPSGEWLEGVEVFRQLYTSVGFGAAVSLSRLPGIAGALNVLYDWFAANRLKLTGRCESPEACRPSSPAQLQP